MKITGTLHAPARSTPRASAGKNQIRREQLRAKSGATSAVNEGETVGEIEKVPAAAKLQTTTAGTGDPI